MKFVKPGLIFILSVVTTFLLASITGTQIILAEITGFGLDVSLSDRVLATMHDVAGLSPSLLPLVAATLLVAFVIAALCTRFMGGQRTYWYLAAGLTSLPATLLLMKAMMDVTIFASARTGLGMLAFALCGLAGAWVFARFTQKRGV